ncbi:hypothetical protein ACFSSA_15435 [Luteolibacter algae]|uniref:Transporter n=1 Tax=Luteolibacter algae TaxID=454151 RepID=A0ABW5DAC5_9BACT
MKPNSLGIALGLLGLVSTTVHAGSKNNGNNGSFLVDPSPEGPWFRATLTAGFESLHVYRGVDSSSGNPIAWEAIDLDFFDHVHLNLFNGNSFNGEYGELTPSAYLYHDFGPYTASAGMIWYHFPGEDGIDSEEYFFNLTRDLSAGFATSAWFSYNARSNGWYHEVKLSHSLELSKSTTLVSYGVLGYSENYRTGGNGLDNLTFAVGLPVTLAEGLTVKPLAGYSFALDALDTDNEAWVGLNLSYTF